MRPTTVVSPAVCVISVSLVLLWHSNRDLQACIGDSSTTTDTVALFPGSPHALTIILCLYFLRWVCVDRKAWHSPKFVVEITSYKGVDLFILHFCSMQLFKLIVKTHVLMAGVWILIAPVLTVGRAKAATKVIRIALPTLHGSSLASW